MTTSRVAFQQFLFPIVPTYVGTIPPNTPFPYIKCDYIESGFGEQTLQSAVLYTNSSNHVEAEGIVDLIDKAVSIGGRLLNLNNGGVMTVVKGTPFAQHYPQEEPNIKAILINFINTVYKI